MFRWPVASYSLSAICKEAVPNPSFRNPMPASIESFLVPPFLRKGDTVGLVAPSRGVEYDQIRAWVEWMERRGFEVEVGLSIGQFKHQ